MKYVLVAFLAIASCQNSSDRNSPTFDSSIYQIKQPLENPQPKSMYVTIKSIDDSTSTATAFIVNYKGKDYLLTNWHVLTGRETDMSYKTAKPETLTFWSTYKGENMIFPTPVDAGWIEYRDSSNTLFDIVALTSNDTMPFTLDKIKIDELLDNQNEGIFYLFGFPGSYLRPNAKFLYDTPKKIQGDFIKQNLSISGIVQAKSYGEHIHWNNTMENGISGSPVFSSDMKFIGIYSKKISRLYRDGTQNDFGYYWNIEAIKKLIDNGKKIDWSKIK